MNGTTERLLALMLAVATFGCRTRPGDPQLTDTTVSSSTTTTSIRDSARVTRDTGTAVTSIRADSTRSSRTDSTLTRADSTRRTTTARTDSTTRIRTDSAAGTVALPSTSLTDADIANVVATLDRSEVEAARLALTKVNNTGVRAFAQLMIDEHGTSLREVAAMGGRLGWPAIDTMLAGQRSDSAGMRADTSMGGQRPAGSNSYLAEVQTAHRQMMEQLRSAPSGASFDKTYISSQVDAHQKALGIVRQLSQQARNSDLRTHLTNAVSKMQAHLERAQTLQRSIAS